MKVHSGPIQQSLFTLGLKVLPSNYINFLPTAPCPVYYRTEEGVSVLFSTGAYLLDGGQQALWAKYENELLVEASDMATVQSSLENIMRKLASKANFQNPKNQGRNVLQIVDILFTHLSSLYQYPHRENSLKLHYQVAQILGKFLLDQPQYCPLIYQHVSRKKGHFIERQPLLSSSLLLGFLQRYRLFEPKQIIELFLTSYFKDLGMGLISPDILDAQHLKEREKILIVNHGKKSVTILKGRIPLPDYCLEIIENHHFAGILNNDPLDQLLFGGETVFISMCDIITAMTTSRPYREPLDFFSAMSIALNTMNTGHSKEFKLLLNYLQKFFSPIKS